MKKVSHNDKKTQEIIEKFYQQVFWLRSVHWTYQELFESEEAKRLMEKTAHSFFEDINIIFINYKKLGQNTPPFRVGMNVPVLKARIMLECTAWELKLRNMRYMTSNITLSGFQSIARVF